MLGSGRFRIHALSAAMLAGGLLIAPAAFASSMSGTAQSAATGSGQSDPMLMPKHKAAMPHRHHIARVTHKHMFAASAPSRGRLMDTREVRMTAQLNERQLRDDRAGVMAASYGPAMTDADKDKAREKKKQGVSTGANAGLTPGSSSGITPAIVHN